MNTFQRTIDLYPNDARAYNAIGRVYRPKGQVEKAIEMYQRSITLDPASAVPYTNLGLVYSRDLGDYVAPTHPVPWPFAEKILVVSGKRF